MREGKFFHTPDLPPARVTGGPSQESGERLAAYDCRPPPHGAQRGETGDRQPYAGLPATSARNEKGDSRRAATALPTFGHRQPPLGHSSQTPGSGPGRTLSTVWGELVQTTDGRWMTRPPSRGPNGHALGPNQVLVGHVACLGHGGGGHMSWHCRICDAVVYGPPMAEHCTALEGPATVRISTSRD
jgi:hypothetical protein